MIKRISTSELALKYSQSVLLVSLANTKVSLTVHSLIANAEEIGTRNFANIKLKQTRIQSLWNFNQSGYSKSLCFDFTHKIMIKKYFILVI